MDNIQLCYIDNEINKIDKMKQGDVIYKNGMELLVVLSYDHNEQWPQITQVLVR